MPKQKDFEQSLDLVVSHDSRYKRAAYYFLRDALDYTVKARRRGSDGTGHVNGPELLDGIRQYALKEFGPMVPIVLEEWGITRCEDLGEMVFNLIRVGIFGKSQTDQIEDFKSIFTFHDAFVVPFLPKKATPQRITRPTEASELH